MGKNNNTNNVIQAHRKGYSLHRHDNDDAGENINDVYFMHIIYYRVVNRVTTCQHLYISKKNIVLLIFCKLNMTRDIVPSGRQNCRM